MILALLVVLAAQTAPPDPAAPPPPPAEESKPPVVELKPGTPPKPVTPATPEAPPAPAPDKRKHVEEKYGIAPLPTGALQVAAGTGACCVGCCVSVPFVFGLGLVPVVGSYLAGVVSDAIIGVAIGGTEAAVGDVFGQQRAPLAWPVAVSAGFLIAGTVGGIVINVLSSANGIVAPTDPTDQAAANRYLQQAGPYAIANVAVACGSVLGAVVVPAVVYGMTAVDKKPGDTGQGFPGILEPASPQPVETKVVTVAMRY